jgi:hypothetical protein
MLKPKLDLEIASLMDYELAKTANNHDFSNLNQAVDYLNSAIDVLENSGFTAHADALLNVLQKIASFEKSKALMQMPSLQFYQQTDALGFRIKGKSIFDILGSIQSSQSEGERNKYKAILNDIVRSEGSKLRIAAILDKNVEDLTEEDFRTILEDNYLTENKAGEYLFSLPNLRKHLKFDVKDYFARKREEERKKQIGLDKTQKIETSPLFGKEEISGFLESKLPTPEVVAAARHYLNKLAKQRKPKNPTKTPDTYTKNLNSDKMIKNLKGHGTVFNMPDSNQADDLLDDDVFEEED